MTVIRLHNKKWNNSKNNIETYICDCYSKKQKLKNIFKKSITKYKPEINSYTHTYQTFLYIIPYVDTRCINIYSINTHCYYNSIKKQINYNFSKNSNKDVNTVQKKHKGIVNFIQHTIHIVV